MDVYTAEIVGQHGSPSTEGAVPHPSSMTPPHLSRGQLRSLTIVPMVTASLSLLGSCCVIYMIVSQRKKRLNQAYHRLMLVMSCYDILWSFWLGLSTIPVPKETGAFLASGNQTSCRAQGFFSTLGIAVFYYNCALMIYFVLVIRYKWRERRIARFEKYVHLVCFVAALTLAVTNLSYGNYHPVGLGPTRCFIAPSPQRCHMLPEVPCQSGRHAPAFLWWLILVPGFAKLIIMLTCNLIVIWTVYSQSRLSSKQGFSKRSQQNNRLVVHQSIMYCIVYVLSFAFVFSIATIDAKAKGLLPMSVVYPITMLAEITLPIQGFLNFLIYVRARFFRIRRLYSEKSLCFHVHETIFGNKPLSEHRRLVKADVIRSSRNLASATTAEEGELPPLTISVRDEDCLVPSEMYHHQTEKNDGSVSSPRARRKSSIFIQDLQDSIVVEASATVGWTKRTIDGGDPLDRPVLKNSTPTLALQSSAEDFPHALHSSAEEDFANDLAFNGSHEASHSDKQSKDSRLGDLRTSDLAKGQESSSETSVTFDRRSECSTATNEFDC